MRAADRDAFGQFVDANARSLLGFAVRLTGDRLEAEELLQTVLVATALRWGRITRRDDPSVYVRRALVNGRAGAWRRRGRETLFAEPPARPVLGGQADVDERLAMRGALASLPPGQRAVLVLRYYEDLSEEQIAAVLGCSRGTVKSQASKALATLRERLGRREHEVSG